MDLGITDQGELFLLALACGEAAANAVVHASLGIIIAFALDMPSGKRLVLTVASPHVGNEEFPKTIEMPADDKDSGRGLPIITEVMDRTILFQKNGWDTVLMVKEVGA